MKDKSIFFVTDIECDGPDPAKHSMLSFATVACSLEQGIIGQFEANLATRAGYAQDAQTMAWWKTQSEAYQAATTNPRPPTDVMPEFADWVESFPSPRAFAANPLIFDGGWIDAYLRDFVCTRLFTGPFELRKLFDGYGLDLGSYLGGLLSWPYVEWSQTIDEAPAGWRGKHSHTHRAIDDALGYAEILLKALALSAQQPPKDIHSWSNLPS